MRIDKKKFIISAVVVLIVLNVVIWNAVLFGGNEGESALYFLDVGQGDSQLISLPDGVQILIDGGADGKVVKELGKILPATDRYIDLVIMTHPQYDHFGGLVEVLKNYEVGAFISNNRKGTAKAYQDLAAAIREKNIPYITLVEADRVTYGEYILEIISPSERNLLSSELNDTSLVILFQSPVFRALYTGDIGADIEEELAKRYDVKADVLKVSHHGSRFSSSRIFLDKVKPKIAIIEVGKNSYGHPTSQTLDRLANIGSLVFRTDSSGTVKVVPSGQELKIYHFGGNVLK